MEMASFLGKNCDVELFSEISKKETRSFLPNI